MRSLASRVDNWVAGECTRLDVPDYQGIFFVARAVHVEEVAQSLYSTMREHGYTFQPSRRRFVRDDKQGRSTLTIQVYPSEQRVYELAGLCFATCVYVEEVYGSSAWQFTERYVKTRLRTQTGLPVRTYMI